MQDHYTTEQLRDRGWTSLMIKADLGKTDEERSDPNGLLGKTVKLYRIERVHAAETGAAHSDLENGVKQQHLQSGHSSSRRANTKSDHSLLRTEELEASIGV
jgi:hypothetical protein